MNTQQVLFARHSNSLKGDAPFSSQRALNMFAEGGEPDDYGQIMMRHSSGLRPVFDFGAEPRAIKCVADRLYVVAGRKLWEVGKDQSVSEIGAAPDGDCTFISGNRTQIAIASAGNLYVHENGATAIASGNNAPSSISTLDYLDGFGIVTLEDTDQWFVTNLVDFNNVNALDFVSAESQPDRALRVLVDHREVWIFGPKTIEVFYNSGGADFPFQRANEAALERGLVGKMTPAKMDNSVYWLGDDLEVKRADGYVPKRVSTHAVERCIADLTCAQRELIRGFVYREEGHKFYCLRMPNGAAWLYDAATDMWHERGAKGGPWLATATEHAHGVNWAIGGTKLFVIDRDYYLDDDQPIRREMISPPIHFGDKRFSPTYFAADVNAGQGTEISLELQVSKDRGNTWFSKGSRSLGGPGEFSKVVRWRGFAQSREMFLKLTTTSPGALSLYGAHVAYSVGHS